MALRNTLFVLALTGVLAGCAGPDRAGVQPQDLRKPMHFVTEMTIGEMDFPSLQRNLFLHRDACGSAPRFVMHEGQTGYASLIETPEIPDSYEDVVLADLVQYPESIRSPMRVIVRVYSYYYNSAVQERVDRMLGAVRNPGVCEPAGG